MDFPIIVIDSNSNSIKDSEEGIDYLRPSVKDDYNFLVKNSLQIQSKSNDDGDSGIHGSSEVFGPSPVPSHKMLIENDLLDHQVGALKKTQLSLSASSLLERKRSFTRSFIKQAKNRNYSMDTGRPSSMPKRFSPYKLMIVDEHGQPFYVQKINKDSVKTIISRPDSLTNDNLVLTRSQDRNTEKFVSNLCQIQLLLIIMKIVLGSSITVFGIYLHGSSKSLQVKDCGYWASSILLVSGLVSVYFASENLYVLSQKMHHIYTFLVILFSGTSSIICLMASIYSGVHGNWISFHANECHLKEIIESRDYMPMTNELICCFNFPGKDKQKEMFNYGIIRNLIDNQTDSDLCGCFDSALKPEKTYVGLSCKYLFSSLKDHFVLICSLMGVGCGCEIWFVLYLIKYVFNRPSSNTTELKRERSRIMSIAGHDKTESEIYQKHLPSPLIPVASQKGWHNLS